MSRSLKMPLKVAVVLLFAVIHASGSSSRKLLQGMNEDEMIVYCFKPENRESLECIDWVLTHKEFQADEDAFEALFNTKTTSSYQTADYQVSRASGTIRQAVVPSPSAIMSPPLQSPPPPVPPSPTPNTPSPPPATPPVPSSPLSPTSSPPAAQPPLISSPVATSPSPIAKSPTPAKSPLPSAIAPSQSPRPKFVPVMPIKGDAYDAAVATRLATYASAFRCKISSVLAWNCTTCSKLTGSTLVGGFVAKQLSDPDALIVNFDTVLNAIVITFRSTYCSLPEQGSCFSDQWLDNLVFGVSDFVLNGTAYKAHTGFLNTWKDKLRSGTYDILGEALKKFPLSTHNGIYFNGHSRGGGLATIAIMDTFFHSRKQMNITTPSSKLKLFTFGQPRAITGPLVAELEKNILTRYRVVNNADFVSEVPFSESDWLSKVLYLVGAQKLVQNAFSYRHFGPVVQVVDLIKEKRTKICDDGESSVCGDIASGTLFSERPYKTSLLTRIFLDHGHYLGQDLDNEACNRNGRDIEYNA